MMDETNGFKRRTLAKKKSILEAARSLFFDKGASGTSMAAIAKQAGVSQVSIYNYFSSKDNLLGIIIREHLEASLAKAEEILDLDIPFSEKIARFFSQGSAHKDELSDETLTKFNWDNPKVQAVYHSFVKEKQVPFLMRFIEMGKAEGAIKRELSTEAVMAYFAANMAIYKDKDLLNKGKEYLASLGHLFFYGLLGK